MMDCIIVGAGFSGAVLARKLAEECRATILLLEKRKAVGGNAADRTDSAGVLIHQYGPHIFHTDNAQVMEYLRRFSGWQPYEHRVLGRISGELVPIPFNFRSTATLFPKQQAEMLRRKLTDFFPAQKKVSVLQLVESDDTDIAGFGQYVYDHVFKNYTAKQWGTPIEKVDKATINRVPVILGYDDRYFGDAYQFMPSSGYTRLFENLLRYPGIEVRLGCDASECLSFDSTQNRIYFQGRPFDGPVIWTGPVDELLACRFGELPYRSLDMRFETLPTDRFQPAAVVNYPNEEEFTRITEFKQLTLQQIPGVTTVMREYPLPYVRGRNLPFYPISRPENLARYQKYLHALVEFPNLFLCGRLAEYRYYNMDKAIEQAISLAQKIRKAYFSSK